MLERIPHGAILELRLERPPANALSPELISTLEQAVRRAPAQGARALVLSGRPGMFSAGLDVPLFVQLDRERLKSAWRGFFALMEALASSPVPAACAITGHAPAGGCVLALCCHWRVMASGSFKIGLNEVAVGVRVPDLVWASARHVLGARAAERVCTGAELFEPEAALGLGLVDELAPPEEVVPRALRWAEAQLALPPITLRNTRELCRTELLESFEALDEPELERFLDEWSSDEAQAALREVVARLQARKK